MLSQQQSSTLSIAGDRQTGLPVLSSNITACLAIANVLKSSLGPLGLDKMLVDSIGEVTVSNDGATILKLLEVEHPAAKILVDLAQQQDEEVGDGTTSVVILAAELLKQAGELVAMRVHPSVVISGYRMACKEASRFLLEQMAVKADTLGKDVYVNCARTALASKILSSLSMSPSALAIGGNPETAAGLPTAAAVAASSQGPTFFAQMAVDAVQAVKTPFGTKSNEFRYPVKAINILKAQGQSAQESVLVNGYAINVTPASQFMPRRVKAVKVACLDIDFQKGRLPNGISIEIHDPAALEACRHRELALALERIRKVLAAGANLILTCRGIDDPCMKPIIEANAMAFRRCRREDLKRIAKATGAAFVTSMAGGLQDQGSSSSAAAAASEEVFEASQLGHADEAAMERFGDSDCLVIRGTRSTPCASVILRGPNDAALDEEERALHDALCVVKRTLESGLVVPGAGAVETGCSVHLDTLATSLASKEQLAVAAFARALLVLPRTLLANAGVAGTDCVDLMTRLVHAHRTSTGASGLGSLSISNASAVGTATAGSTSTVPSHDQQAIQKTLARTGLDLQCTLHSSAPKLCDPFQCGILEPALVKLKAIKLACECAISVLRVDELIRVLPEAKAQPEEDACQ